MRDGKQLTEKEKQWLIDNYHTKKQCDCARHLNISKNVIRRFAKELGIYEKKTPAVVSKKPKAKPDIIDVIEDGKGYCLECAYYVLGGTCGKNGRITGALHKKGCFKANE